MRNEHQCIGDIVSGIQSCAAYKVAKYAKTQLNKVKYTCADIGKSLAPLCSVQ